MRTELVHNTHGRPRCAPKYIHPPSADKREDVSFISFVFFRVLRQFPQFFHVVLSAHINPHRFSWILVKSKRFCNLGSWAIMGHLGARLGHLGAILGHRGASWGHVGIILGYLGGLPRAMDQWPVLSHGAGVSTGTESAITFWDHFGTILKPFWDHFGTSKRFKNHVRHLKTNVCLEVNDLVEF